MGAHWLDDVRVLSCKDSTGQHATDDPLLSCKQARLGPGGAENATSSEVLPQQQIDQHRQYHRGDSREQHHEQAAKSTTQRAHLQVPKARAAGPTADRNRKPLLRQTRRHESAGRGFDTPDRIPIVRDERPVMVGITATHVGAVIAS